MVRWLSEKRYNCHVQVNAQCSLCLIDLRVYVIYYKYETVITWSAELNAVLQRPHKVAVAQLDNVQAVGLLHILYPLVCLALWVDHQRPSPRIPAEGECSRNSSRTLRERTFWRTFACKKHPSFLSHGVLFRRHYEWSRTNGVVSFLIYTEHASSISGSCRKHWDENMNSSLMKVMLCYLI